MQNDYLEQVVQNKAEVEGVLRKRQMSASAPAAKAGRAAFREEPPAVDVRITGILWWRTVVVPPNAFVVHTRRGRDEPVTVGMGKSFRYNPRTDSFLVVPAAMQTIVINANCICQERQGILVQAYVQWVIDDFAKAYRRLDFSDPVDPMKVVNVQLQEQAEATIKDAVATMSIDDVLADKQPIIVELTRRLGTVAHGGEGGEGLGLRIVTVQIKEAVISSARLWNDLQLAFRAERRKIARLAELGAEAEIRAREDEVARQSAELEIARKAAIDQLQAETDAKAFDQGVQEASRRAAVEAELAAQQADQQRVIIEHEAATRLLRVRAQLALDKEQAEATAWAAERQLDVERKRQEVANLVSPAQVQARLVEQLPVLAKNLPKPEKLTSVSLGGLEGLTGGLRELLSIVDDARAATPRR